MIGLFGWAYKLADEIVIVRFGNAKRADLAGPRFRRTEIVDVADAIDLGSLG